MRAKEFMKELHKQSGVSHKDISAILEVIGTVIRENETTYIPSLGRFKIVNKPARTGVLNKVKWSKPAYKKLVFSIKL